jgi:hypothetical protein
MKPPMKRVPADAPDATLPAPVSLMRLLMSLAPLFTAPSFRTFCGLAYGFLAQVGRRTVCGMLAGAGLSRLWPHDRAHQFFSRARWSADDLGLAVARLVVALLVPAGQPVTVAIDDTLFRRRDTKVWALSWFHDGLLAWRAPFAPVTVTRYGKTATVQAAAITCLWYGVFGSRPIQVVLIRGGSATRHDLALVTTDLDADPAAVTERYAARWSIEVAIEDARQVFGTGQARNRTARVVERTVPFQLACQAIATVWYATAGHHPADIDAHRARAPWYATKSQPSTADMLAKLRRVLIAAKFRASWPGQPTLEEIHAIRWPGRTQRHNSESRVNEPGCLTGSRQSRFALQRPSRPVSRQPIARSGRDRVSPGSGHRRS